MTEPRPLKVFLCHASAGKSVVRKLSHRLAAEGWIDPWLDEEKLSFGQHWTTVIEDALDAADIVLIFLSRNSVQKEGFVQRELNYAWELSLEKPRNVIFLIPFRLDDCEVPRYLSSRQWGDYFGEKEESTYQILLRSLKQRHEQKLRLEAEEQKQREAANRERMEREAKEKAERDAAEKLALEKAERENAELAREIVKRKAAEKAVRKKAEREVAEKVARQKADRDIAEKAEPKNSELPVGQIANLSRTPTQKKEPEKKPARKFDFPKIVIATIIIITLLFGFWGVSYFINQLSTLGPTHAVTPTDNNLVGTIDSLVTSTVRALTASAAPTATLTPKPPTPTSTPKLPTSIPTLGIGSTKDGMTLVFVPAGEFTMGSEYLAEQSVYLDSFWIDQTEVTNKMYAWCVQAGVCRPPKPDSSWGDNGYFGNSEYEDYPMVDVDWYMAKTYCEWAGRRLPTEAEWEKAARGTDAREYPWGNDSPNDTLLNYNYNIAGTTEVGKYPAGASIYGALDMAGNVEEWVSSLDQFYPYSATDGREDLNASGPRVLRGGAWYDGNDYYVRTWFRLSEEYGNWGDGIGFRCALSP